MFIANDSAGLLISSSSSCQVVETICPWQISANAESKCFWTVHQCPQSHIASRVERVNFLRNFVFGASVAGPSHWGRPGSVEADISRQKRGMQVGHSRLPTRGIAGRSSRMRCPPERQQICTLKPVYNFIGPIVLFGYQLESAMYLMYQLYTWVISHVPIFHMTQPLGIWSIINGYFFR